MTKLRQKFKLKPLSSSTNNQNSQKELTPPFSDSINPVDRNIKDNKKEEKQQIEPPILKRIP